MSVISSPALFMGDEGGYTISRSVRLRSSASAYLNRTYGTPTSTTTWTYSYWVKRGALSSYQTMVSGTGGGGSGFLFNTDNTIGFYSYSGGYQWNLVTTQVFRDPSAWYHIIVAYDSTQATSSNRVKIYVNGSQVTSFSTATYPSLNVAGYVGGAAGVHRIGLRDDNLYYFDGYITEVNFIDGQALTPSSFGETDAITGVWKPKRYTGTYGTNGFYLNFSDNSNNTAATIGKDYSGNGNNWTPNNISVTTGSTYDSMLDTPTPYADGGNGRGNYAVWNPLKATAGTYSNANLSVVRSGAANVDLPVSTLQIPKTVPIYCEFSFGNQDSSYGIAKDTSNSGASGIVGSSSDALSYGAYITTSSTYYGFWNNNTRTSFNFSGGTVYQMAFDQASGKLWFGKDGTWYNSGNPAAGTNPTFSSISTTTDFFVAVLANTSACSANFGQRPFTYTPPTGFKALNTQNLPEGSIKAGNKYFDATLWTGTGASNAIVNSGSMQPDLVWVKKRNSATNGNHYVADSVRGANKIVITNGTNAEFTTTDSIMSFNSNGFTVLTDTNTNNSTETYVGWQWKAGGTTSSNTSGSITSTVSANATAGFSVVTYTGTGANATVGHGLGVAPSMIIIKQRSTATSWAVYHSGLTSAAYVINLNLTSGQSGPNSVFWNSTAPTSTVFSLGTGTDANASGATAVAYCWAEVAGFSKFGSYTGNGSDDGPFVYCGFRPRFLLIKNASTAGTYWEIWDSSRDLYNVESKRLYPNASDAENGGQYAYDFLSNGFKARQGGATDSNQSGATIIYAAFAENPFKNALAR